MHPWSRRLDEFVELEVAAFVVVSVVSVSDDVSSLFASYTYLWVLKNLTWIEANATCSNLSMDLPSISSDDELELISHFLLGEAHLPEEKENVMPILTPCRLESPICVIFLGLWTQVGFIFL